MGLTPEQTEKLNNLRNIVRMLGRTAVAFSAGVDSTLLLKVCHDELGDDVVAVTVSSISVPIRELQEAKDFCEAEGIHQEIVHSHEFDIPGFAENPPDRCYICKRELLSCITAAAHTLGFETIAEGSNADDAHDYRPGSKAVEELGIHSPLREAGLDKADVRAIARHLGLDAWDKPAFACLNTRFAYGDRLTKERLTMVDAVENALIDLGFPQVRARFAQNTVRIEIPPEDIVRITEPAMRTRIVDACKQAGFTYVSLDLEGYRTGAMNETIR